MIPFNKQEKGSMLLGLHTYSLYLHGIGQAWAGFELPWARQLSTFELFDLGLELGLNGFHLDDGVLESLDKAFLAEVAGAAQEKNFFLEYNMSLDLGNFGIGIQHDLKEGLATAQDLGIRLALENHCDSFSEEILWVLKQVDHPFVGACIDTMNAWHIGEDPMRAIENLAPLAFTNHFRDDRIEFCRDGFKVTGVAVGDGDIDMKKAYQLIKEHSPTNRINIETEMGISLDNKERALALELETVKRSIHFCRTILNINQAEYKPDLI